MKKKRWYPLGPSQGQGSGPPDWGGMIVRIRPLLLWTKNGGGTIVRDGSFFFVPKFYCL